MTQLNLLVRVSKNHRDPPRYRVSNIQGTREVQVDEVEKTASVTAHKR